MKPSNSHYVDRAYISIKNMIANHEIKPNQHLYISQLSDQLNLSTTPVREALNRLLNDGFVVRAQHRGFKCPPIDLKEQAELFDFRLVLLSWALRLLLIETPTEKVNEIVVKWRANLEYAEFDQRVKAPHNNTLFEDITDVIDNREVKRLYTNCMDRCGYIWRCLLSQEHQYRAFCKLQIQLIEEISNRNLAGCDLLINQNREIMSAELQKLEKSEHAHLLYVVRKPIHLQSSNNIVESMPMQAVKMFMYESEVA